MNFRLLIRLKKFDIDVPLAAKSAEILAYSQSQLTPLLHDAVVALRSIVPAVVVKKAEVVEQAVADEAEILAEKVNEVEKVNGDKIKKSKRHSKTVLVD